MLLFSLFLLSLPSAFAAEVVTLYDQEVTVPASKKNITIQRFVSDQGTIGIAASSNLFDYSKVLFVGQSGLKKSLGVGGQVFEKGTVKITATAPTRLVLSFLPHSSEEKAQFISLLKNDPEAFEREKRDRESDLSRLCDQLKGQSLIPSPCGISFTSTPEDATADSFAKTDPSSQPVFDFSGQASRAPVINIVESSRQVFLSETVAIRLDSVIDPDGKCRQFQYEWKKSESLEAELIALDQIYGDLQFIPRTVGVFSLQVRAKELCEELGTMSSVPFTVQLIVKNKAKDFPDLKDAGPYQNSLLVLYHLGAVKGYPDGSLKPQQPINRVEFLKLIFETLRYRISNEVFSSRYPDVLPSDWFAPYVSQADSLGVIKGYPDSQFKPGRTISLVEALKIAMHFTTLDIQELPEEVFSDVPTSSWFRRYVLTGYREGILDDITPGKKVNPHLPITRGKAAQIIVRTFLYPVNRINQTNKDVLRRPDSFVDFSSFKD